MLKPIRFDNPPAQIPPQKWTSLPDVAYTAQKIRNVRLLIVCCVTKTVVS
jgi:hypothetical protein